MIVTRQMEVVDSMPKSTRTGRKNSAFWDSVFDAVSNGGVVEIQRSDGKSDSRANILRAAKKRGVLVTIVQLDGKSYVALKMDPMDTNEQPKE